MAELTPPSVSVSTNGIFGNISLATINGNRYAYGVNNTVSPGGLVSMYSINNNSGVLTQLSPSTIGTGSSPNACVAVTTSNGNSYLYVVNVNNNSLSLYTIDNNTGILTALSTIGFGTPRQGYPLLVTSITISGNSYLSIVNNARTTIAIYAIDNSTGLLTQTATPLNFGSGNIVYFQTINNSYLYAGINNTIRMYAINNSGVLSPLSTPTVSTGQEPSNPSIVTTSNGNQYLYIPCFTNLYMYNISNSTGILTPLSTPSIAGNFRFTATSTINGNNYLHTTRSNFSPVFLTTYSIDSSGILTSISALTYNDQNQCLYTQYINGNYYLYGLSLIPNSRSTLYMFSINSSGVPVAIGSPIDILGTFNLQQLNFVTI